MSIPTSTIASVEPHSVYAPTHRRYVARCACGWESIPSLFRAMVIGSFDRHAASAHGVPLPGRASDSLAACHAEVHP